MTTTMNTKKKMCLNCFSLFGISFIRFSTSRQFVLSYFVHSTFLLIQMYMYVLLKIHHAAYYIITARISSIIKIFGDSNSPLLVLYAHFFFTSSVSFIFVFVDVFFSGKREKHNVYAILYFYYVMVIVHARVAIDTATE